MSTQQPAKGQARNGHHKCPSRVWQKRAIIAIMGVVSLVALIWGCLWYGLNELGPVYELHVTGYQWDRLVVEHSSGVHLGEIRDDNRIRAVRLFLSNHGAGWREPNFDPPMAGWRVRCYSKGQETGWLTLGIGRNWIGWQNGKKFDMWASLIRRIPKEEGDELRNLLNIGPDQ